jgi:alginate production protein
VEVRYLLCCAVYLLSIAHGVVEAAQDLVAEDVNPAAPPVVNADAPPPTPFVLSEHWRMGINVSADTTYENARSLSAPGSVLALQPEPQISFLYERPGKFRYFTSFKIRRDIPFKDERPARQYPFIVEPDELYARWEVAPGAILTLGRARMTDRRNWIFGNSEDKNDSLQFQYRDVRNVLQFAVVGNDLMPRNILRPNVPRISSTYLATYERIQATSFRATGFVLAQDRIGGGDGHDRTYFGLRARGNLFGKLDYWTDSVLLRGTDGANKLRSYAYDIGMMYTAPMVWSPRAVVSYAFGSGDGQSTDGIDRRFHETGLSDQKFQFNGVSRFKYYGEAVDPDLSNIGIATAAVGARLSEIRSIDVVYHHYVLDHASGGLYAARIDRQPTGVARVLGDSIDLIVGHRDRSGLELEMIAGYFMPGAAFGHDARSHVRAQLKIKYNFTS